MKNTAPNFGKNLRKLREAADLSQVALAKIMRTTQRSISKWENGHNGATFETLVRLGRALGIHPGKFFG